MNVARMVLHGGLWGAALLVVEALGFERWLDMNMRSAAFVPEVGLNGFVYGALVALAVTGVVHVARRRRIRTIESAARRQILADTPPLLTPLQTVTYFTVAAFTAVWLAGLLHGQAGLHPLLALASGALAGLALGAVATAFSGRWPGFVELALVGFVVVSCAWSPMATAVAGPEGRASDRPNVVLVCMDNVRADFVSAYGCEWSTTPTLDSLAAVGTRFEKAIAASSWGLPATASLLTSTFPSHHGASTPERAIRDDVLRVADVFDEAGYRTGAFSENRFVTPNYGFGEGFDSFWAYQTPWVFDRLGLYRGAEKLHLPLVSLSEKRDRTGERRWDADVTVRAASRWIREGDVPFFAYLHLMEAHTPYGAPEYLLDEPRPAKARVYPPAERGYAHPIGPEGDSVSDEELHEIELLYASDVAYVDRAVGRLVAGLGDLDLLENTIIVVTSNHGEEFYEHRGWGHGASVYQEIARVPLIVAGAGVAGRVVDDVVRTIDVAPTILDLAGLDAPAGFEGRPLTPMLEGESLDEVPALVEGAVFRSLDASCNALVTRFHSLVEVSHAGIETTMLFDLSRDPFEKNDLAQAQPSLRDAMKRELLTWRQRAAAGGADGDVVHLDGETEDALRSLGYVN